ncbi:hypothetical protein C8K38_111221 [Rhodococcus sp. OK611]|uniref:hypothetical protein n=1 Tax=unclassified Rhodococcus (in: high G+C Gram-positive bacteria) TaxID=192944 RepID=UPI000BD009E3|nr:MULTISPECIES: hypothetical protein [unclassified Rhodococcus (in: high G+C Gram-positive bacteria)]PTR42052.1 hypothetical protein C8K38_111221 [Rhodococcus sp. OK611]SNX91501.1 hypothetical protein SAMN05447004_11036 [Rhodococcus sp. OK270]
MITVLCCRGIGEPLRDNMLAGVTRRLDPTRFQVVEVPWAASYGPVPLPLGPAFDQSLADGRALLLRLIAEDPNPVLLLGYSGGAALAGHVAAEIAKGWHPGLEVVGAGLVSDPFTPGHASPAPGRWGIAGPRSIPSRFPVWWVSDPADVICCCPAGSPVRTLADQTSAASLSNLVAWAANLRWRLEFQQWQQVAIDWGNREQVKAIYRQALHDVDGYLRRGDHTGYGVRRAPGSHLTYLDQLAYNIMRSVR